MTRATPTMTDAVTPRWSAHGYCDADAGDVLDMFTEPDFFYRTAQPDTRPEWEILELLGEDTQVLLADGVPIGLFALEGVGAEHACHYQLQLRLRAAAPLSWWVSAHHEVVQATRWRREVIRLAMLVGEFDRRGLELARSLGLRDDGTLADVVCHQGRRSGYLFFSRIWEPAS